MKRLLTIAAVLIGMAGAGQKPDTLNLGGVRLYTPENGLTDTNGLYFLTPASKPKYDTIPIIYMYADTAKMIIVNNIRFLNDNRIYWDFGYEVRERKSWIDAPGTYCANCPPYTMEHIGYLDRHRNPIRKTMIVWQVKQL